MNNSSWESCHVDIDQPGFYVSDISVLGSEVTPLMEDSLIRTLPEEVVVWDSKIEYYPVFSDVSWSVKPPAVFDPDPYDGDDQDLYDPEISMGIPFPTSIYNPSVNVEFPGGFLRPPTPKIEYQVNPYMPPLNLDIPPLSLPDISIPYLALPDLDITNIIRNVKGLHTVEIHFLGPCLAASNDFDSTSTTETIWVSWNAPSTGRYALFSSNGQCYWQPINICP